MYVYYYCHVIIIFCYKVNDSRTKNSKISNCLSILLVIKILSVLFNTMAMSWVLSFNLKYFYKNNDK